MFSEVKEVKLPFWSCGPKLEPLMILPISISSPLEPMILKGLFVPLITLKLEIEVSATLTPSRSPNCFKPATMFPPINLESGLSLSTGATESA